MENHQWQLQSKDGEHPFLFGTVDTGIQTSRAPDLGTRDVRKRKHDLPREDGGTAGAEYETGTTLTFEANVLTEGWAENSDLLNAWRAAWSRREYRVTPDAYAVLKVHNAGRTRRCYGRPARFTEADSDLTHEGYTGVVATFETRDGRFYDEAVQSSGQVPIRPPSSLGFTTPIVVTGTDPDTVAFQTETLDPGQQPGNVTVQTETWPWTRIYGPVTNPSLDIGALTLELDYTIPDGMSVLLDPRPWARRVIRSDGANLAGRVTWRTPPMGEWLLTPGSYELVYRGTDATGTSHAEVFWREGYRRP